MSTKNKLAALCLTSACAVAFIARSEQSGVAVEPIEVVAAQTEIDWEEIARRSPFCDCEKKCNCLDCVCGTRPEGEGKWQRHKWSVDGKAVEGHWCWYGGKCWGYSDGTYYLLDDKGSSGTPHRESTVKEAALRKQHADQSCANGSCSVGGGCSSGSCGVRGRVFGRRR